MFKIWKRWWGPCADPVFIIGTGRSGTHWLADTLKTHPELSVTYEVHPRFDWSTSMGLNPRLRDGLLPRLIRNYRLARRWAHPRRLVDKSHPNLWILEELRTAFRDARFLGIQRGVHATVASMIRCAPVNAWHARWREFPVPNLFLGIPQEMAPHYEGLSNPEKCTLRWLSHRDQLRRLNRNPGDHLLVVDYENLMDHVEATLAQIGSFLKLGSPLQVPVIKTESRTRWKEFLTPTDVARIDALIDEWDMGSDRLPRNGWIDDLS